MTRIRKEKHRINIWLGKNGSLHLETILPDGTRTKKQYSPEAKLLKADKGYSWDKWLKQNNHAILISGEREAQIEIVKKERVKEPWEASL